MSDQSFVTPLFIGPWTKGQFGWPLTVGSGSITASTTWPTANLAFYSPVTVPYPFIVRRVFWANGSAASGNRDFGIYTADGTRVYSTGSTAVSGASAIQYVTPTAFLLPAGRYYFALSVDNTTANAGPAGMNTTAAPTRAWARVCGMLQQASALPLPSSATFAAVGGTVTIPLCGITSTASGF